jgi:phage terminase large subunit
MNAKVAIDWSGPDYVAVANKRLRSINYLNEHPEKIEALKEYYRDGHIVQFINDWGVTLDPRNAGTTTPVLMPFILFPRQVDWIEFTWKNWKDNEFGITEKSRDMGVSWLAMAFSCALCILFDDLNIGFGSQQWAKVDTLGDPSCLFYKGRAFMEHLPRQFRAGWNRRIHAPEGKILFPETGSAIIGECGDEIGRSGRTTIYFIDEAAHIEHPLLVDQSLSATTNCRFDMSSVNGSANPFADKARSGKYRKFTFHWRDDPRKNDEWYAKLQEHYDPVTIAKEYDINYAASVEGVLIPSEWVQSAIGAHLKLGIEPTGSKYAGLDVADEGADKNAFAGRHGFLLQHLRSWSGKGGDIFKTVMKAFELCDAHEYGGFDYDADGLGAGVRGDARVINEARREKGGLRQIDDQPFRGSGAVWKPDAEMVPKRKNKDHFANLKAQAYWALRLRFQATHRAVIDKLAYNPDDLICIDPALPELGALIVELSQPTYDTNTAGKKLVEKTPEGAKSPNLADAVMICFQPAHRALDIWKKLGE